MAPDGAMHGEKILSGLGAWGALRSGAPLVAALASSILLLEILTPSLARLLPGVTPNLLHFFVISIALLLGVIGHFMADVWDRVIFARWYGPHGSRLDTTQPPLMVFPAGAELKRLRALAVQALPRKPESDERIDREVVKIAQRQLERWERIEHPLILARFVRGFLWPCLFVAFLGLCAALIFPLFGVAAEAPRFLATGGGCLVLALLLLIPYSHLRVEHMVRLYQDVAEHAGRRKPDRR